MIEFPSRTKLADEIAAEVLSGNTVTAIRGCRGVGKTTMLQAVAAKLVATRQLVVVLGSEAASSPHNLMAALLSGFGAENPNSGEISTERLRSILARPRLNGIVLLIDDAQVLSPQTLKLISLLADLAKVCPTGLSLVLFGTLGPWPGLNSPDLERLRWALRSTRFIYPLSLQESSDYLSAIQKETGRKLNRRVIRTILDRAEGVPAWIDVLGRVVSDDLGHQRRLD